MFFRNITMCVLTAQQLEKQTSKHAADDNVKHTFRHCRGSTIRLFSCTVTTLKTEDANYINLIKYEDSSTQSCFTDNPLSGQSI